MNPCTELYESKKESFSRLHPEIAPACIGFHIKQEVEQRHAEVGELGCLLEAINQEIQSKGCPMKYTRPDLCEHWNFLNDYAKKLINSYQEDETRQNI